MENATPNTDPTPWWGSFSLSEETGGRWEVGPSTLWLYRTAREWRLLHHPSADPVTADSLTDRSGATVPLPEVDMEPVLEDPDDDLQISRHSFRHTEPRVALKPALTDRPVVSRPEHLLHVPPGESVTLYLSTAVWIRITLPDSGRQLQEVPSFRMSDTWFGDTTVDGEFCYATRTAGRLCLDHLPRRFHRAVIPLHIKNKAKDGLALERVQLPAPYLALYTTPNGQLWTQDVTITRMEGREGAGVDIRDGPPADIDAAEQVQDPRETNRKGLFTSTFSAVGALFGS